MDLAALTIFRAVVRENGVTRAALKLNRVQSNVTTRIKQLEEQLGVELFTREGRRLVLTPAGETLLPYAEKLLALADEARHALKQSRPTGRLRLGTMESTVASRLPRLLAQYHQHWPEVELELQTATTDQLIQRVRDFEVDAALIATPVHGKLPEDICDSVPMFREELLLLTPRGHGPVRDARDIALSTLVAFERGCAYRAYVEKWYMEQGLRPSRVLELGSYHAMFACVAAGAGVAVAPRSVFDAQPDTSNIDVHSLGMLGTIDTLLIWRRGHYSSALGALREMLAAGSNLAGEVIADARVATAGRKGRSVAADRRNAQPVADTAA
jgi:DNA-binding transcriptional LysR family regulator